MSKYIVDKAYFDRIMPQKSPMRFVDGLLEYSENEGVTEFVVGEHPCIGLDEQGNLPLFCLLEVMAQSACGFLSYKISLQNIEFTVGLLLSVRSIKLNAKKSIPKGTQLIGSTKIIYEDDSFRQVENTVKDQNGQIICSGSITVFSPTPEKLKELFGDKTLMNAN